METKKSFEKLFGYDVKGKMKEWVIEVVNYGDYSSIMLTYGYVDGKKVESVQRVDRGKNIGKSNETTHFEQAIRDATSKWKKKLEQGFKTDQTSNQEKKEDSSESESDTGNVITFPMLANDFGKCKKRVVYPVYVQPKLDGYRMLYNSVTKYCNSRQGKEFGAVKNTTLYNELQKITDKVILDGELYKHGGIFEHLGILRKKKLSKEDLQKLETIEYHVYDIVDETKTYEQRYNWLKSFMEKNSFTKIRLVDTKIVGSEDDLKKMHLVNVENSYEGSMVRIPSSKYRCKARSQDLLKYKDFEDSEYKIVDFTFEQDTASDNHLVVWICQSPNGNFNVRPKGTKEERAELYKRGSEFIGQQLHVKYFELTELGIPRFPTTKSESYTTYIRNVIE
jgi:ATP-dependent DNA ligase